MRRFGHWRAMNRATPSTISARQLGPLRRARRPRTGATATTSGRSPIRAGRTGSLDLRADPPPRRRPERASRIARRLAAGPGPARSNPFPRRVGDAPGRAPGPPEETATATTPGRSPPMSRESPAGWTNISPGSPPSRTMPGRRWGITRRPSRSGPTCSGATTGPPSVAGRIGEYPVEAEHIRRCVLRQPDNPTLHIQLAGALYYVERETPRRYKVKPFGDALGECDIAVALNPDFAPAYLTRAMIRKDAGLAEGSRADLDRYAVLTRLRGQAPALCAPSGSEVPPGAELFPPDRRDRDAGRTHSLRRPRRPRDPGGPGHRARLGKTAGRGHCRIRPGHRGRSRPPPGPLPEGDRAPQWRPGDGDPGIRLPDQPSPLRGAIRRAADRDPGLSPGRGRPPREGRRSPRRWRSPIGPRPRRTGRDPCQTRRSSPDARRRTRPKSRPGASRITCWP